MVIVGGGVIGTEYASILATMGVPVTLIDKRPRLLEFVDAQIIGALQRQMTDIGVTLYHEEEVVAIRKESGWTGHGLADAPTTDHHHSTLMYAIGRIGSTKSLEPEAIGITPDTRGRVIVNDHFQTSVPPYLRRWRRHRLSGLGLHIHAARAPCRLPCLWPSSTTQTRTSCPTASMPFRKSPWWGGMRRDLAKTGTSLFGAASHTIGKSPAGQLIGDETGTAEAAVSIATPTRSWASMPSEKGATELIHIGQAVMAYMGKIDYFIDTVFNYPTLAECYRVTPLSTASIVCRGPGPSRCRIVKRGAATYD